MDWLTLCMVLSPSWHRAAAGAGAGKTRRTILFWAAAGLVAAGAVLGSLVHPAFAMLAAAGLGIALAA
ncbi:MAG: hypothetical protein ACE5EX_06570, partial [Phycisphaerae bacterium]